MRCTKRIRMMAAAMSIIVAAMFPVPSLAGMPASGQTRIPGLREDYVKRNITAADRLNARISSDSDEAADIATTADEVLSGEAGGSQVPRGEGADPTVKIRYTIDGKELVEEVQEGEEDRTTDHISFYVSRDPETNDIIMPPPAILEITQTEGETDAGYVIFTFGDETNPDDLLRPQIEVRQLSGGGVLYRGDTLKYEIMFRPSEDLKAGRENINNSKNQGISVIIGAGKYEAFIPVYYGIDGLYSYYSAESTDRYEGTLFQDRDTGRTYRVVGQVSLNETEPPAFTIRHKFGVFDGMTGTDEQGNTVPLRITRFRLNPDGYFTFPDGGMVMMPEMGADGWVSIPLQVKPDVFSQWRRDAMLSNRTKTRHMLLTDLLIEYNDGYWAGGNMNPLPLVFKVSYTASSGSGGGGGGGGGGGSSSGTTSTGTIAGGPVATPRVTKAAAGDIGWVQRDGVWYYMDASNKPVTDWLLGPDGRWYFLDGNGIMKTGWLPLGGVWYFLNADGAMATGWVQNADGKWYYLQQDGKMAVDMTTPDGHYVDKDGVWVH